MSSKKRFYIDTEKLTGHQFLKDRDKNQRLVSGSMVEYSAKDLEEVCDLLNKGHEETEAER